MYYIYKLYNENGYFYIGMSQKPTKRYRQHLYGKGSCSSKIVIQKGENINFEILHNFKTYEEAKNKEGELIRKLNCVNKRVEGRDSKEYYKDNRETILNKMKKYYKNNAEVLKQKSKEYKIKNWDDYSTKRNSKINCPNCGAVISKQYISVHKKTKRCNDSGNLNNELKL